MRRDFTIRRWTARCALLATLVVAAPSAAWGQINFGGGGLSGLGGAPSEPVEVSAEFTKASDQRPAVLMITATIDPGWYIYSITQPPGGPQPTSISLDPSPTYQRIGGFRATPQPESHVDQEVWPGLEIQEHRNQVTWYAPIELAEGVTPESAVVEGTVRLQACKESCIPMNLSFTASVGEGVEIGPLDMTAPAEAAAETPAPAQEAAPTAPASEGQAAYDLSAIRFEQSDADSSLALNLLLAFGGGLVLNLMPCVLPVIGLKVMSFVQQAGHSRRQALALNLWYSVGIMSVFWVLAVLAVWVGLSWGEQFGNATFNIVMASIVFVMALSLFGLWEIPVPEAVGRSASHSAVTREGPLGAYLKGVLTTLLATPCTGPGMAVALGWAVRQPASSTLAVFTVMGVGMASPYLVIGAFPGLVRWLPKPGEWMVTFKQLMGFLLVGTVIFLLSILPSYYLLPTLVLLTALALACWVFAKTPRTGSLSDLSQTGVLCGAIVLAGGVFAYGWLAPKLTDDPQQRWRDFSLAQLHEEAVQQGNTVLVDFGADWCANCQVLEKTVLHTEPVEEAIRRADVVTMFADNTNYPPEIEQTLRALNSNGVPVIAIFPGGAPYEPIVFRGMYTQNQLVEAIEQASQARATIATSGDDPSAGRLN